MSMQKRESKNARSASPGRARKPSDTGGGGSSSSSSSAGGKYRYCVLPGNESVLLKEALQRRPWWEPAPENSSRWNLWAGLNGQKFDQYDLLSPVPAASAGAPASSISGAVASTSGRGNGAGGGGGGGGGGADPFQRRCVNRLQEHRVLCTKSGLAGVLATLVQAQGRAPGRAPAAGASAPAGAAAAAAPGGAGGGGGPAPGSLSWIPETYVVPAGPKAPASSPALARFKAAFTKHAAAGRRVWIAKPTSLNRGNGIEVFDSLDRTLEHVKSRPAGSNLILQKYIENPLLLGGRKFDIRAYVLVGPPQLAAAAAAGNEAGIGSGAAGRGNAASTASSGISTGASTAAAGAGAASASAAAEAAPVWFHREAYVRTSGTPYDPTDLANRSAHLTNDAVQKSLDTYHAFEDHCKLSFAQLGPELLRQAGQGSGRGPGQAAPPPEAAAAAASAGAAPVPDLDTAPGSEGGLWGRMRDCVGALLGASAHLLNPRRLGGCWELMGLDFMLDDGGGLYLIEVNTSPALFRAGSYLADLLPRLVEEVVQRAVDPLFPPPPPQQQQQQPLTGAPAATAAGEGEAAGEGAGGGGAGAGAGAGGGGEAGSSCITPLEGFVRVKLLSPPSPPGVPGRAAGVAGAGAGTGTGTAKPVAAAAAAAAAAAKGAGGAGAAGVAAGGQKLAPAGGSGGARAGAAGGAGSSNGRVAQSGSSTGGSGGSKATAALGRVYGVGGGDLVERLLQQESAAGDLQAPGAGDRNSAAPRSFLKVPKDAFLTNAATTQRLYQQGSTAASVAYLLHSAAEPMSLAEGSSNALLPYLDPPILRRYASGPRRRSSPTAELLYGLALDLYGPAGEAQMCQHILYKSLRATFAWLRDHVPLRLVGATGAATEPGSAAAALALPDPDLTPDADLAAAVLAAVSDPQQLGGDGAVDALLQGGCEGVSVEAFARAVPRVAAALAGLQADLSVLQSIAAVLSEHAATGQDARSGSGSSSATRRAGEVVEGKRPHSMRRLLWLDAAAGERSVEVRDDASDASGLFEAGSTLPGVAEEGFNDAIRRHAAQRHGSTAAAAGGGARRLQQAAASSSSSSTYLYGMPPRGFNIAPPAKLPKLFVPLIFHVMLYKDVGGGIGPANYDRSLSYLNRVVRLANYMARPSNIQFFIKEARNDPAQYPYLLLKNRQAWLDMPTCNATATYACLGNIDFMAEIVADFPRSINLFLASDADNVDSPAGYAYAPGSDKYPDLGYAFIGWDIMLPDGFNSLAIYNYAPMVLMHELFHHLGLQHPFGPTNDDNSTNSCSDDDYVSDTPVMLGSASSSSFYAAAIAYCMELFWQTYGGDWDATYTRWSSTLGVPEGDMNAWADSCPTQAGYDLLGNYMTYNTPVCYAALGHLTRGQVEQAHYVSAEVNPLLYAWGQYYAATSPSPPPQPAPPPEAVIDACKVTRRSACACKESWTWGSSTKSYCGTRPDQTGLWCEVDNPVACIDCADNVKNQTQCVLRCGGTEWMCYGTGPRPPPPPPRLPSLPPMPPPPPPRAVPEKCKVASNGCKCRSTWRSFYNGSSYWSYCASPVPSPRLYCQVESTCPFYNATYTLFYCDRSLTLESCNVQEVFLRHGNNQSTIAKLPSPPPPKRGSKGKPTAKPPAGRKPPRPPPPAGAKAGTSMASPSQQQSSGRASPLREQ
ncbi:hypothetical protein HXX76_012976 [Chlamydomonas incerta]|uniref:Uncharacterized protein n=1 Tax=Chlamydomonas incerta TaxID=51695 RepID=A0A835SU54_CHLIN|nr:hypothetical protein HXX76_012976 [Chlamydomonas incerta]|eukprot:KAG2426665.1 hypothetical protein HXX76_012976 [Chlamydomonas incerta]